MKKLILNLKNNRLAYAFIIPGLLFILFPDWTAVAIPYVLGAVLIAHAAVMIIFSLKLREEKTRLGESIVRTVICIVLLYVTIRFLS